ncbi:MAG TPA: alkaline phosphatase family protein [Anaerolineales bacterium]|nr:alkaline phosphatase family protein [Anaerolineales bacterium]HLO33290.1 alkaline phosphatase family protein [Anaerolineales bacterium]
MKKVWTFYIAIVLVLLLSACGNSTPTAIPTNTPLPVDAARPCIGSPAPTQWHHIVVLMFENKSYDEVIGPAPYITSLANKCATASNWQDANTKVDGSPDGKYASKPNYATLTNGLSPSAHELVDDTYATTTKVDNIYNQLNLAGLTFKDYYEGEAGGCSVRFSGDYHDPIRYYDDMASICNAHDVPLSTFLTDLNSGNLPAFSMILPTNQHNMHSNSVSTGDAYAQTILDPLLNSPAYAKGDLAIFFLWDENTPIPNVLIAPSVATGTKITVPSGNPISHFSAPRTWEEMLGLPLLGDAQLAPSLLPYFGNVKLSP